MPSIDILRIGAGLVLASLPFVWIARHLGARRRRDEEGKLDGTLMLAAVVVSVFSAVMATTSGVRSSREAALRARSQPVSVEVQRCTVKDHYPESSDCSHELHCSVQHEEMDGPVAHEVTAGFPANRGAFDAWVAAHPPGSRVVLYRDPRDAAKLSGFDLLVPATTNAASAARGALLFGVVSAVLFALSRAVVARRRASGKVEAELALRAA